MNRISTANTVIAGLVGTGVMTMMMLMAPMMGMPKMNIGEMLAGFMGMPATLGWIAHFIIDTLLAVIYANVFLNRLPGTPWIKGMLFSLIPWFVAQVVMSPMMGAGFFASNTPAPVMMVMGSLIGHLVYGAVIGIICGQAPAQARVATS